MGSGKGIKRAVAGIALLAASPCAAQADAGNLCPQLRWTTLGTAGGPVPTADRSEPANLLDVGGQAILVDAGDGTVDQMARAGRSLGEVRIILLSHLHWDHVGGVAAVLGLRWMNTFPGEVTVYGPPGTAQLVDGIVASLAPSARIGFGTGARVADPASGIRVVELRGNESIALPGGLTVRSAANSHFDFGEDQTGTLSLSYRFDFDGRSITYTGDTGPTEAVAALAAGSDLLVSEVIALEPLLADISQHRPDMAPETQRQMQQHLATHHVDAVEAGKMAAGARADRLVLTHLAIPGPVRSNEAYLLDGVRQSFHGSVDVARDLSSFDVGCTRPGAR